MPWKTMTLRGEKGSPLTNAEMDANLQSVLDFMNGVALPNGPHNLDDYDVPGVYGQNATAGAQAGTNYPVDPVAGTPVAGILKVWKGYPQDGTNISAHQEYRTYYRTRPTIFYRNKDAGGWGPWFIIAAQDTVGFPYMGTMAASQNLNDQQYLKRGYWVITSSSIAAGGTNFPIGHSGVLVTKGAYAPSTSDNITTGVMQEYISANGNARYSRALIVNTWSPWIRTLDETDKQTSKADKTAEKLLVVGSFGIGGIAPNLTANGYTTDDFNAIDDVTTWISVDRNMTNGPLNNGASTPYTGVMRTSRRAFSSGTAIIQELFALNRWFYRFGTGVVGSTAWQSWREVADVASAMTHATLSAATDANTLVADNTWWSWTNSVVMGSNFPPAPIKSAGVMTTQVMSSSYMVQTCLLVPSSGRRPIEYRRVGNGATTWSDWRLIAPLQLASDLPTADCGDAYVDGLGLHRYYDTAGYYVRVPQSPKFREGLGTEWASATTMLVKPGSCASMDGRILLELTANNTRTLQKSGAYVHGSSGNALVTGVAQANWMYYVFLLRRDSDGMVAVSIDTNPNHYNRPAGYSHFRRIGTIRSDASANIKPYTHIGNEFWYDEAVSIYNGDTLVANTTYQPSIGLPGIMCTAHFYGWLTSAGGPSTAEIARQVRGGGYSSFETIMTCNPSANHIMRWSQPSPYAPGVAPAIRIRANGGATIVFRLLGYTDHFED